VEVGLETIGDVLVARVRGRCLDAYSCPDLVRVVEERIGAGSARIVVDLAEVTFLDSSGLGSLVRLLKQVPDGGGLVLCGCQRPVAELLRQARVDRFLVVHGSREAAVASFRS
jgi:anti-sigma B factor antagonist